MPPVASLAPSPGTSLTMDRATPAAPRMTVVVNAYRRRTFLREAVQSVIDQTLSSDRYEVIVVKDFEDEDLDRWLSSLGTRVRVVTEDHPGVGAGLARGVELARGDIVAFLEDDDRFHREKLEATAELFRSDARVGFVRNSYAAIGADGQPVVAWERLRPAPSLDRSLDPSVAPGDDLAWVFRYAPHINVSTMSFRTSLLRAHLDTLRQVGGAVDSFLFVVAAASGARLAIRKDRWNDYRVHPSLSHASMTGGNEAADLRDLVRSKVTGELMESVIRDENPSRFVRRFVTSFRLEVDVTLFLLEPSAHFSLGSWATLGRSALWRRQRYLLFPWAYCLYRWLAPRHAVRAYRARRSSALRRAAGLAPGP